MPFSGSDASLVSLKCHHALQAQRRRCCGCNEYSSLVQYARTVHAAQWQPINLFERGLSITCVLLIALSIACKGMYCRRKLPALNRLATKTSQAGQHSLYKRSIYRQPDPHIPHGRHAQLIPTLTQHAEKQIVHVASPCAHAALPLWLLLPATCSHASAPRAAASLASSS